MFKNKCLTGSRDFIPRLCSQKTVGEINENMLDKIMIKRKDECSLIAACMVSNVLMSTINIWKEKTSFSNSNSDKE